MTISQMKTYCSSSNDAISESLTVKKVMKTYPKYCTDEKSDLGFVALEYIHRLFSYLFSRYIRHLYECVSVTLSLLEIYSTRWTRHGMLDSHPQLRRLS